MPVVLRLRLLCFSSWEKEGAWMQTQDLFKWVGYLFYLESFIYISIYLSIILSTIVKFYLSVYLCIYIVIYIYICKYSMLHINMFLYYLLYKVGYFTKHNFHDVHLRLLWRPSSRSIYACSSSFYRPVWFCVKTMKLRHTMSPAPPKKKQCNL